jgi:hypothetical protein
MFVVKRATRWLFPIYFKMGNFFLFKEILRTFGTPLVHYKIKLWNCHHTRARYQMRSALNRWSPSATAAILNHRYLADTIIRRVYIAGLVGIVIGAVTMIHICTRRRRVCSMFVTRLFSRIHCRLARAIGTMCRVHGLLIGDTLNTQLIAERVVSTATNTVVVWIMQWPGPTCACSYSVQRKWNC